MSIVSASDELNSISFHDLYLVEFLNVKLHTLSQKMCVLEGICMYVCTYVHTYVRTYVRVCVCMYVCLYKGIKIST
mgnify:CR=1 FL=1